MAMPNAQQYPWNLKNNFVIDIVVFLGLKVFNSVHVHAFMSADSRNSQVIFEETPQFNSN